ncbi:MAG: hypothetical protein EHM58_03270 [Ignavibacteriae bacterium]|nr:MAG: hypothetical protein EHM58_03270 [Ignavibacteriota bacterium]
MLNIISKKKYSSYFNLVVYLLLYAFALTIYGCSASQLEEDIEKAQIEMKRQELVTMMQKTGVLSDIFAAMLMMSGGRIFRGSM